MSNPSTTKKTKMVSFRCPIELHEKFSEKYSNETTKSLIKLMQNDLCMTDGGNCHTEKAKTVIQKKNSVIQKAPNKAAIRRTEEAKEKIKDAIARMKKNGDPITKTTVADESGTSRNTVRKFWDDLIS